MSKVLLSRPYDVPWATLFTYALWNLWQHRNKFLFAPPTYSVEALVKITYSKACMFWHINAMNTPTNINKPSTFIPRIVNQYGDSIPNGFVTVSVHAFFQNKKFSGIAIIIHDTSGSWLKAISVRMFAVDFISLALWAIFHGLLFASNHGHRCVVLQSVNMHALSLLYAPFYHALLAENLIFKCRRLMEQDWILHLRHVHITENQTATKLARHASQQENSLLYYNRAPPFVSHTR